MNKNKPPGSGDGNDPSLENQIFLEDFEIQMAAIDSVRSTLLARQFVNTEDKVVRKMAIENIKRFITSFDRTGLVELLVNYQEAFEKILMDFDFLYEPAELSRESLAQLSEIERATGSLIEDNSAISLEEDFYARFGNVEPPLANAIISRLRARTLFLAFHNGSKEVVREEIKLASLMSIASLCKKNGVEVPGNFRFKLTRSAWDHVQKIGEVKSGGHGDLDSEILTREGRDYLEEFLANFPHADQAFYDLLGIDEVDFPMFKK